TIAQGKENELTKDLAAEVEKSLNKLGEVAMDIGQKAMSDKIMQAFAHAYSLLEVSGDVVMAWMLLWRANVAASKLDKAKKKDVAFYQGQLKNLEYFVHSVLPTTRGKMNVILQTVATAVEMEEDSFGGK
ncbi:MAG: acyl-CoA dehydrogenase C-terminal domain-containing protein, partial [Desulfohalobiaceae bacterium]